MQLAVVSTHSPFLLQAPKGATPKGPDAPLDAVMTGSAEPALGLIPARLANQEKPEPRLSLFSLPVLQAGETAEGAAVAAAPWLGVIPLAKQGDKEEILALFDRWNTAIKTRDPDKVLAEYAPDAILLPTLSNKPRHNHAEIRDYFEHFLAKGPQGKIDESNVRTFGDIAVNSGIYTFSFANGDQVQARYTYVYRKLDGEWKIVEHHSSAMPEKTPH